MTVKPSSVEHQIPKFCPRCGVEYEVEDKIESPFAQLWHIYRCPTPNCQAPEIEFAYRVKP